MIMRLYDLNCKSIKTGVYNTWLSQYYTSKINFIIHELYLFFKILGDSVFYRNIKPKVIFILNVQSTH
jgi:hypothetical protein